MNVNITAKVQKSDEGWMVVTTDGRDFGPYGNRDEARKAKSAITTTTNEESTVIEETATVEQAEEVSNLDLILADMTVAHQADDKATRNDLINQAAQAGMATSAIAAHLGLTYAGVHRLVGREASAPRATRKNKFQEGYAAALADLRAKFEDIAADDLAGAGSAARIWLADNA